MQSLIFTLLLLTSLNIKSEIIKTENCSIGVNSEFVYSDDFNWGMNLPEVTKKEDYIYYSGKRLKERAYSRDGKVFFPLGDQEIEISLMFIKGVIQQVESAFSLKYVDALIFPDMGHSHFFIPMDIYNKVIGPVKDRKKMYETMYSLPELKVLYHTAEQIKMIDDDKNLINDDKLIWRYNTRNIVGDMSGSPMEVIVNKKSAYNTSHKYGAEGEYRYWGGGFNISGSADGCFAYQRNGKTFYFDLSLKDLESSNPGDSWGY